MIKKLHFYIDICNITFNYAHLYPSKQKALADKLNEDRGDVDATEKKEAE